MLDCHRVKKNSIIVCITYLLFIRKVLRSAMTAEVASARWLYVYYHQLMNSFGDFSPSSAWRTSSKFSMYVQLRPNTRVDSMRWGQGRNTPTASLYSRASPHYCNGLCRVQGIQNTSLERNHSPLARSLIALLQLQPDSLLLPSRARTKSYVEKFVDSNLDVLLRFSHKNTLLTEPHAAAICH